MAADLQDRGLDDSGVRLHSDKKSKRKKSTMQDVDEVVTGDPEGSSRDAESRLGKEEKEKKKKKRKRDVENIDQVGDGSREGKERKKRKKDGILPTAVDVDPVTTPPTQSKNAEQVQDVGDSDKGKKKEKKKKHKKHATEVNVDDHDSQPPKKKKRKKLSNSDSHPNPEEDESLEDHTRKALSYVYTHAETPSGWKFNKARQNWLIRNLWSPQTIPEQYFPLVLRYLRNSKGGIRDTLIKSCETSLSPTPTGSDPTSTTNTTTPTTATTTTTSPAPNPTTPSEESSDAQKSTVVHMDVKQDRARKLLEALSSNEEDG